MNSIGIATQLGTALFLAACATAAPEDPKAEQRELIGMVYAKDVGRSVGPQPVPGQREFVEQKYKMLGAVVFELMYPRVNDQKYYIRLNNGIELTVASSKNVAEGACVSVKYSIELGDRRYFERGEADVNPSNGCAPNIRNP